MDIPIWLILALLCIILLYIYSQHPYKLWKALQVKGPEPKIFFGNIHEIFGPCGGKETFAKWQSRFGRIYGIYYFREPALVVTEPDWIKQVFIKDYNNFRDRMAFENNILLNPELNTALFFARGDDWKRVRAIMSPSFSIAKIKGMSETVNRCAKRLGEHLLKFAEDGVPWQAKRMLGAYAIDVITSSGFSIDVDSISNPDEPFSSHGRSLFVFKESFKIITFLASAFPVVMSPISKMLRIWTFRNDDMEFFERSIKLLMRQRKTDKNDIYDILQNLMEAESEESPEGSKSKLTSDEIVAQGIMLFIAGYETASSTLQFLLYELATRKDVMKKITDEIDDVIGDQEPTYELCQNLNYTEAAINETLRMYPPLSVLTRECSKPTKLFHLNLPSKTAVIIPVYNLQRDPEFWKNPNEFNPERFIEGSPSYRPYNPLTFMPFGIGPRLCIGMLLGLLEMKLALVHIFKRVSITKATPEVLLLNDFTMVLQPSTPIKVYCTPRIKRKQDS
ncbi:G-protein coupled receptor C02B8.5 [Biomphalaria glabrata]|nr:G-protein coupled receptor C02B8.5 [Biomphalaria glabrata]